MFISLVQEIEVRNLDPFRALEMTKQNGIWTYPQLMEKCCQVQGMNFFFFFFLERWSFGAKSLLWVMTSLELFRKSLENIIKNYTILDLGAFILPKSTKCFHIEVISFIFITSA